MKTLKRTMRTCAATAALATMAMAPTSSSWAATGTTNISISLDPIIILHYFSTVSVTLDSASLTAYLGFGSDAVDEGSAGSLTGISVDLNIQPDTPAGDVTALPLELSNAWAVRAIGGAGNITLEITTPAKTLTNGTTAEIVMVSATVADGSSDAATITFAPPGLFSPRPGDVKLQLDLTNATLSGSYTGGQYTLTATSI